jgi:hypothetical protein
MRRTQSVAALASVGLLAITGGCAHPRAAASVPGLPGSVDPPGRVARLSSCKAQCPSRLLGLTIG